MTALVINGTQVEGGGGSLANATQDVVRSAEEQNEKENLFCLCLTIVVA